VDSELPEWAVERLAGFERHLAAERGLSPHTVRAYLGDVSGLLEHACAEGLDDLAGLDIGLIRAWLAAQHASGVARATLARRTAAARAFTAFARSRG
jgi:integrase/recombinase XerC